MVTRTKVTLTEVISVYFLNFIGKRIEKEQLIEKEQKYSIEKEQKTMAYFANSQTL